MDDRLRSKYLACAAAGATVSLGSSGPKMTVIGPDLTAAKYRMERGMTSAYYIKLRGRSEDISVPLALLVPRS